MQRLVVFAAAALLAAPLGAVAQVPVQANPDHEQMLASTDAKLAANKRFVYDFWREVFEAAHLDLAEKYMAEGYVQHNPNVPTGRAAFVDFFSKTRKPEPIKAEWKDKPEITIVSGSYVFMMFKRELMDPDDPKKTYPAYWFDMVRVDNGLVQEHWDSAVKNPPAPAR